MFPAWVIRLCLVTNWSVRRIDGRPWMRRTGSAIGVRAGLQLLSRCPRSVRRLGPTGGSSFGPRLAIDESLKADGVLFALAATALHALDGGALPDLIIGARRARPPAGAHCHGAGRPGPHRLGNRSPPHRWCPGYTVLNPENDDRRDYRSICDASGDSNILDSLLSRLSSWRRDQSGRFLF